MGNKMSQQTEFLLISILPFVALAALATFLFTRPGKKMEGGKPVMENGKAVETSARKAFKGLAIFLLVWVLACVIYALASGSTWKNVEELVTLASKDTSYFSAALTATPTTPIKVPEEIARAAAKSLKSSTLEETIKQVKARTTSGTEYQAFLKALQDEYKSTGTVSTSTGTSSAMYW
jgi:hypothetical protein